MRPYPLTVLNGGIDRLRVKGGASANKLYDLTNAYITNAGTIAPREGTSRYATLTSQTIGLAAANGTFNVFAPNSGFQPLVQNSIIGTTTGGDGTFASGTTYYFEVTAVDTYNGETVVSNEQSILATGAAFSQTISWLSAPGAVSYNVYYGTGAGLENKVKSVGNVFNFLATSTTVFAAGSLPRTNTTLITVPAGFTLSILSDPHDRTQLLKKIWFAKPFMGFEFVVAQFANNDVVHYWLQNSGTWTTGADYTTASIVLPLTLNGLAYQAIRHFPTEPPWTPETVITSASYIEPNTPTGFAYQAIAVAGSPAHTGAIEPVWPTVAGAIIQEFGDYGGSSTVAGSGAVTGATISTAAPLSNQITDRYGDSNTISNAGIFATQSLLSSLTLASTKVKTWTAGTTEPPGNVVVPTTTQGGFINAIPNGDAEGGNIDFTFVDTGGAAAWSIGTGRPYQGTYDFEVGGGSMGPDGAHAIMTTALAVTPGQSVTLTGQLDPNNNGSDLNLWLELIWYNGALTSVGRTLSAAYQGGGYHTATVTGMAPANAVFVKAGLRAGAGTNSRNTGYADLLSWNLESATALTNFLYEAVQPTSGITSATEPAWPTVLGATVIDGTVTWQAIGTSIITWQAIPLMQAGVNPPVFPTTIGNSVYDSSTYTNENGYITSFTSMGWLAVDRSVSDTKDPDTVAVTIGASHVFAGDNDIVDFSAAVNPLDWTSTNNAGYLPTGLNNYGDNPVTALALYRGNLIVFNAGGYQMWQIDPDPQNMAFLDAQPVGCIWTRSCQSVANDLIFLTEVGVRNLGTIGATANMAIGNTGQPVDPLIQAQITTSTYDPFTIYYPGRGQYMLIYGPLVFVLTINGLQGNKSWSRYIFPQVITDATLNSGSLFFRTAANDVWQFTAAQLTDDSNASSFSFSTQTSMLFTLNNSAADSGSLTSGSLTTQNGASFSTAVGSPFASQPYSLSILGTQTNFNSLSPPGSCVSARMSISSGSAYDVTYGGADFTIEGWFQVNGNVAQFIIMDYGHSGPLSTQGHGLILGANAVTGASAFNVAADQGSWQSIASSASATVSAGVWYHFAVVRKAGLGSTYINGIFQNASNNWFGGCNLQALQFGCSMAAGGFGCGYVAEVRFSNTALYTSAGFTPPTMPFSAGTFSTAASVPFNSVVQWPYIDMGGLGLNKMLIGIDLVGDGAVTAQVAYDQTDKSTFSDQATFTTSTGVTTPYFIQVDDTVPGEPLPFPVNAPSYSLILTFPSIFTTGGVLSTNGSGTLNTWTFEAANFYLAPQGGGGVTG